MKNVLKIITIISMLLLTVFAGGCGKSQDEKYMEARNEFVALQQKFDKENAERQKKMDKMPLVEFCESYIKIVGGFQKEADKKLENMAEIAKGKLELVKDVEQVKRELHKKYDQYFNLLGDMEKELKKAKQKQK